MLLRHLCRTALRAATVVLLVCGAAAVARAQTSPSPFSPLRLFNNTTDGAGSGRHARLIQASNGLLYGTNPVGGSANAGTLYRMGLDGAGFTVLKHFTLAEANYPVSLIEGRDGRLYGVTSPSSSPSVSTIFSIALDGTGFTVLRRFVTGTDPWFPETLLEGSDGQFYGIARTASDATRAVFRFNRSGASFTIIRALSPAQEGSDDATLIEVGDTLYGTARTGGSTNYGIVFRLNRDGGGFSVLKRFAGTDGRSPNRLVASGGRLFGTTSYGGGEGEGGVLYRLDLDGNNFTVLHRFRGTFPPAAGTNPSAGLTTAPDGSLYGTTTFGGALREYGTIFRYDPSAGRIIFLKEFNYTDGAHPLTELLLASDRKLYGIAPAGGTANHGALFSYSLALPGAEVGLVATVGQPFTHTLLFGASATGLPAGVAVTNIGVISGTPTESGTFQVTVQGPLNASIASTSFTLTVAKGTATLTATNLTHAYDGTPKSPTITTNPAGLPFLVAYSGTLNAPAAPGSYPFLATITAPHYTGTTTGTLVIGDAAPRFTAPLEPSLVASAGTAVTLRAQVSVSPPATYTWQRKSRGSETWIDLALAPAFSGLGTASLTIVSPATAMHGDQFRLVVANPAGSITSEPLTLLVRPTSVLTNVSVRAQVAASQTLVVGFVTTGTRPLLVRGVGPGLAPFLPTGFAGNPALTISSSGNTTLAENDDWAGTAPLADAFSRVGAFPLPLTSQDAAVLLPITAAASAQLSVRASGLALVEVYNTDHEHLDRLVNLSALHHADIGADALVAGFNLTGTGTKALLIRGIGPGLRPFGVTDALVDPSLQVLSPAGAVIAANDDWPQSLANTFTEVAAFPLTTGSRDAALIVNLAPGSYTIQLTPATGSSGRGLIEIYELP